MKTKRINQPTGQRYLTVTLVVLMMFTLITLFLPTPVWAFWALLALAAVCVLWFVWIMIIGHRTEYQNLMPALILLMVTGQLIGELNPPDWWNTLRLVALVPLGIWAIRYALKEWRHGTDNKRNHDAKQMNG